MVADLQAAVGQHMCPNPVLHHMELPLDCDGEGCLLSDQDKGRLARIEVLAFGRLVDEVLHILQSVFYGNFI